MPDLIKITGIRAWGHHGVLPEETRLGQRFRVNLQLELDTRPSAISDDLTRTVDYAAVVAVVVQVLTGKPCRLIETLAENIAAALLDQFTILDALSVEVEKPSAPVGADVDGIAVQIRRVRHS